MKGEWQFIQTLEETNQNTREIDSDWNFELYNVSAFYRVDLWFLGL